MTEHRREQLRKAHADYNERLKMMRDEVRPILLAMSRNNQAGLMSAEQAGNVLGLSDKMVERITVQALYKIKRRMLDLERFTA